LRSPTFSRRTSRVKASAIREILKVTERPEILSFAGGLPAPEAFPVAELARAHAEVFAREGAAALQYSTTEGFGPLRAWVAERMRRRGLSISPEQVLITSGSQQGIDLVARILVDPGDAVVVESPSYLAALQVFAAHEASFVTVGSDEHGMRVDQLERALKRARPKLVYLVPTFQNPKGTTLALERREQLARLAAEHGVAVLEDDPYGELRYSGAELPAVASLDRRAPIIYLSTFSKTLAPGLRIGWVVAAEETVRALTVAKQACDLHTATLAQRAAARLLESFDYAEEDFRQRQVIEARREADTILTVLAKEKSNRAWQQLTSEERRNVETLEKALVAVKDGDDYHAIRAGIDALNEATMHFAELMMDTAVSTALKGKSMDDSDLAEGPQSGHRVAKADFK